MACIVRRREHDGSIDSNMLMFIFSRPVSSPVALLLLPLFHVLPRVHGCMMPPVLGITPRSTFAGRTKSWQWTACW